MASSDDAPLRSPEKLRLTGRARANRCAQCLAVRSQALHDDPLLRVRNRTVPFPRSMPCELSVPAAGERDIRGSKGVRSVEGRGRGGIRGMAPNSNAYSLCPTPGSALRYGRTPRQRFAPNPPRFKPRIFKSHHEELVPWS